MAEEDQKSKEWHAGWAAGSNAEHHQWNQKQIGISTAEIERISINKQISVNTQKLHDKFINDLLENRKENDNG